MRITAASLRRLLRSPRLIVGEIAGITLGGLTMAIVPQTGAARGFISFLALDRVASSPWFLALLILAIASLGVVLVDQTKRALLFSKRRPIPLAAGTAPYRREAVFAAAADLPASEYRVRGVLGHWGSPLFHAGVLVVIVAGLLRLVFGADASVDLLVGETLASGSVYDVQRPGLLGSRFAFPQPFRLDEIRVERYPSGETKAVEGVVSIGEGMRARRRAIAINDPTRIGIHTLYITARGGSAVLVDVASGVARERHAILLHESEGRSEGSVMLADGTVLHVSSDRSGLGVVPALLEVRAARGSALAGMARLRPFETMPLPGATAVSIAGIVPWVQISGQRDLSTPIVYVGFILICIGGLLMVAVVPVETFVVRENVAAGMRLKVAMRPRKFAPLFAPAFEDLWRRSCAGLEPVEMEYHDECA